MNLPFLGLLARLTEDGYSGAVLFHNGDKLHLATPPSQALAFYRDGAVSPSLFDECLAEYGTITLVPLDEALLERTRDCFTCVMAIERAAKSL